MTTVNQMTTQAILLICTIILMSATIITTDQIDLIKKTIITIMKDKAMTTNTTIKTII